MGIIFAIVFKALNGYLSSGIEYNEKNIEIYLQRNTDRILRSQAEELVEVFLEAAVTEEDTAALDETEGN